MLILHVHCRKMVRRRLITEFHCSRIRAVARQEEGQVVQYVIYKNPTIDSYGTPYRARSEPGLDVIARTSGGLQRKEE